MKSGKQGMRIKYLILLSEMHSLSISREVATGRVL